MPITPILPVALDALQAVALGDGLRDGRIVEAKVTAVLSNTLARLEIDGQPLVVRMTKPLPVGVAMTVKVEREAGQLRLLVQGPISDVPDASVRALTPQRTAGNPAEPEKAAFAKIQGMAVEAMLDDNPAAEPALAESLASMAGARPEVASEPRLSARTLLQPGQNDLPPPSGQDAPDAGDGAMVRNETPQPAQVHGSSTTHGSQARIEQTSAFTIEIPIYLPGNNAPLQLHVTQQEDPAKQNDDEPRSPYWTVRFAAEAGRLGMVHAAISLIEGHIGVQLWAEQEETADAFKQNAFQLRDALHASDLKLDGLNIIQGGPFETGEEAI